MAKLSDELLAMVRIERTLQPLDEATRSRILGWLMQRFGLLKMKIDVGTDTEAKTFASHE